jgi:hypothetical protein
MTLGDDVTSITHDTRPFPNATEICKPFIEDGPGNTMGFMHSTVPQYTSLTTPHSSSMLIVKLDFFSKMLMGR